MSDEEQARRKLLDAFNKERESRDAAQAQVRLREAAMPAWRKRLRGVLHGRVWVIILVVGTLAIVGGFVGFLGLSLADRFAVTDTVKQFCVDEAGGHYEAAYQLVSTRVRQSVPLTTFEAVSKNAHLLDCVLAQNGARAEIVSNRTTIAVDYIVSTTNASTGEQSTQTDNTGTMTLVHEAGGWRIDHIDSSVVFLF